MIDIIKANDIKFKEKMRFRKKLNVDKNSNFRAYEPDPKRKNTNPQYFRFDNLPPQVDGPAKINTPKFADNDRNGDIMMPLYPLDSTKNPLSALSPVNGLFSLYSPSDKNMCLSSSNCQQYSNTKIYSPSSLKLKIEEDDVEMRMHSTKNKFVAEMIAMKNGGLNAFPDPSSPQGDVIRPKAISPNAANLAARKLN